jgi:hypothetical protein
LNAAITPAQAKLKGRKLTQWQENFARYIYQETGYVADIQTLKLTLLLQKQYRASPWNKARLGKGEEPHPLPELPYMLDEIRTHVPEHREEKVTPQPVLADGEMEAMRLTEAGTPAIFDPVWQYRARNPFTTTFTPEPQPDTAAIEKLESKIDAARKKAGRRKVS